jgi:AcrR family transcriptional regulator
MEVELSLMAKIQDPMQAQLVACRRNQILDAATTTFARRGFHNTTIRQIAQEAGLADGTIYIYFKSKTDLLIGLLNRLNESEQRPAHFAESIQGDPRTYFTSYLRQRMNLMEANLQTFRAILPEILADEELRTLYRTQVIEPTFAVAEPFAQRWIAQDALRPIPPPHLLRILASAVLGLLILRILGDSITEQQWQQFPEVMAELVFG